MNIDHRRTAVAIAPGDLTAYIRSGRELGENVRPRIEVVHRLTNRGAVITYAAHGTSPAGFEAEWREISLSMVDGDLVNRVELFDEADIDAALARFDQLTHAAPQLENAASQVFDARTGPTSRSTTGPRWPRNWPMTVLRHDHRRIVNAGVRHGRDVRYGEHASSR